MFPHIKDWKACRPRGTGIALMPSILRPGMCTNPLGHKLLGSVPACACVVAGARIRNGSGLVVEEVFQRMRHLPFSVLIQLV